jgi:hypothetical protein
MLASRASNEGNGGIFEYVGVLGVVEVGEVRGVRSSVESEEARENLLELERMKVGGKSLGRSMGEETCIDGMVRITCRSWLVISTKGGLSEGSNKNKYKIANLGIRQDDAHTIIPTGFNESSNARKVFATFLRNSWTDTFQYLSLHLTHERHISKVSLAGY